MRRIVLTRRSAERTKVRSVPFVAFDQLDMLEFAGGFRNSFNTVNQHLQVGCCVFRPGRPWLEGAVEQVGDPFQLPNLFPAGIPVQQVQGEVVGFTFLFRNPAGDSDDFPILLFFEFLDQAASDHSQRAGDQCFFLHQTKGLLSSFFCKHAVSFEPES